MPVHLFQTAPTPIAVVTRHYTNNRCQRVTSGPSRNRGESVKPNRPKLDTILDSRGTSGVGGLTWIGTNHGTPWSLVSVCGWPLSSRFLHSPPVGVFQPPKAR